MGPETHKLRDCAKQILELVDAGGYRHEASGEWVDVSSTVAAAVTGSQTFSSDEMIAMLDRISGKEGIKASAESAPSSSRRGGGPRISVAHESTQEAACRLTQTTMEEVAVLNFASARNPGGGFLKGARAQEEDVSRCSALYHCLTAKPKRAFYTVNERCAKDGDLRYTDSMIYSPGVPWFRVSSLDPLLQIPFRTAIITAPAPNAGEARKNKTEDEISTCLRRRCGMVLALAKHFGHRHLVLGAWGCGVFKNDPALVADAFAVWLAQPEFHDWFDQVHFAVYDSTKDLSVLKAFQLRLDKEDAPRRAACT